MPFPGRVHGILAAPPCTAFCRLGQTKKRSPDELAAALAIVDACLRFAALCEPAWWVLENPPGKLGGYLGEPAYKFQPCDFGDPWTKLTYLWGRFTAPSWKIPGTPKPVLPSIRERTTSITGQNNRAATPEGFARAFFAANP